MKKFVFIGQDGTKYVFITESVKITNRGKKVLINGTPVAEYLNAGDAREATETVKEELDGSAEEYRLPVKHFQAEPFVECAWAKESIDKFLEVVKKLPRDFINEFFRSYRHVGLEEACEVARKVTELACIYDSELIEQDSDGLTVVTEEGE